MAKGSANIQMRIVRQEIDPASSTIDFTVSGFGTPKFALIYVGQSDTATTPYSSNIRGCKGWWCANGQGSTCFAMQDGQATTANGRYQSTTRAFTMVNFAGTGLIADYTASSITDGIRLTKNSTSFGIDLICDVVLFGGSSILNVDCGVNDFVSSANITGISDGGAFTPNCALFMGHLGNAETFYPHGAGTSGFAFKDSGALVQGSTTWFAYDAVATADIEYGSSAVYAVYKMSGIGSSGTWACTGFSSGQISGTYTAGGSPTPQLRSLWMAIEFDLTDTDFGAHVFTGFGFDGSGGTEDLDRTGMATDECASGGLLNIVPGEHGTDYGGATAAVAYACFDAKGLMGGFSFRYNDSSGTTNCHSLTNKQNGIRLADGSQTDAGQFTMIPFPTDGEAKFFWMEEPGASVNQTGNMLGLNVGAKNLYLGSNNVLPFVWDGSEWVTNVEIYLGSTCVFGDGTV